MKKVVIAVVGALMLTVGGMSATNLTHTEAAANHYNHGTYQSNKTVDLSGYVAKVVEDNKGKRITLYKDAKGHVKYKTILVKKTGMVKVIKMSR
ncbi:hypothetical protein AAFN87_19695 [Solibacillus sp. CAU 1738]